MRFAIDIIWIRDGVILGVTHNVPALLPGTPDATLPVYESSEPYDRVIETVAGTADRLHLIAGQRVEISLP